MAITRQIISTGTSANDGTGDTLRSAGLKINANFAQLYGRLGDSNNFSTVVSIKDSAVAFTLGSNIASLSVPALTGSRNIRLPDASGVVTLNTATQTLTNKAVELTSTIHKSSAVSGTGTINPDTTNTFIIFSGGAYAVTLGSPSGGAASAGLIKIFTKTTAGLLQLNCTSGTSITLADGANEAKQMIWTGTRWNAIT